jgi:hypothetical protein
LVGPFDDFNFRWYLVVGSALILNSIIQIFAPYFGSFFELIKLSVLRYYDRGFSSDERKTRKVV